MWSHVQTFFQDAPKGIADSLFGVDEDPFVLTGTCQAALMFGSVSPTIDDHDAMTLADRLVRLYSSDLQSPEPAELFRPEPLEEEDDPPWKQGYRLAEEVCDRLTLLEEGTREIDIDAIFRDLGIGHEVISLSDVNIRAVALAGPHHRMSVLLNQEHPTFRSEVGRRFTLAHELCHLFFDRTYGRQLAIASGPWAPRDVEKRANAFAAMLLMPTELLLRTEKELTIRVNDLEGVRQMASSLKTGFIATLEHLTNIGRIDEADHDRIREEYDLHISLANGDTSPLA